MTEYDDIVKRAKELHDRMLTENPEYRRLLTENPELREKWEKVNAIFHMSEIEVDEKKDD